MIAIRTVMFCLVTSFVLVVGGGAAVAEQSADDVLAQIKMRSEKTKQYRDLLNDPDQTTRLAALDVMLKSEDITMRELAFNVGFSSADDAMRSVCLKNKFGYLNTLSIKLAAKENATEIERKRLETWGSSYPIVIKKYDLNTGALDLRGRYNGQGQISGTGFEFTDSDCNGRFALGDGATLDGEISCTGRETMGVYPATIRVQ